MKRQFYLSDKAEQDLFVHARYIAEDNRDAAEKFISSFIETVKIIVAMPFVGKEYSDAAVRIDDMRFFPVRDFDKYLIIHTAQDIPPLFEV